MIPHTPSVTPSPCLMIAPINARQKAAKIAIAIQRIAEIDRPTITSAPKSRMAMITHSRKGTIPEKSLTVLSRTVSEETPKDRLLPAHDDMPSPQKNEHDHDIPCHEVQHGTNGSPPLLASVRENSPKHGSVAGITGLPGKGSDSWPGYWLCATSLFPDGGFEPCPTDRAGELTDLSHLGEDQPIADGTD